MLRVLLLTSLALASALGAPLLAPSPAAEATAPAGSPSAPAPPIAISSIEELQKIGNAPGYPLSGSYVLTQDIDASVTATWNDNGTTTTLVGFRPIGSSPNYFSGVFDGQGHTIGGLVINRPNFYECGLFAHLQPGAQLKNVGLLGGSVSGRQPVGNLVGRNDQGSVSGCYATGAVSGLGEIGGLIGMSTGAVTDCWASGTVTGKGDQVGGLIGESEGAVTRCHATGSVSGTEAFDMGGLVGRQMFGSLMQCYATGTVTATGNACSVGGLVGYSLAPVARCYATGSVSGTATYFSSNNCMAGGLIGSINGPVTQCYATGTVSGSGYQSVVGGLIGFVYSGHSVLQCYATGAVTCMDASGQVGGLLGGISGSPVTECYAVGLVSGVSTHLGGLIGERWSTTVTASYWDTQTTGRTTSDGGTGKNTAQMKQRTTFQPGGGAGPDDWNFTSVWGIAENVTNPYFSFVEQPPLTPSNVAPANGATGVALTPTLSATAFADSNTTDTHTASQWQVREASSPNDWSLTVFDSGQTNTALTSCVVTAGALAPVTNYLWRVRYEDNHGAWSGWSAPTTFRTGQPPLSPPTSIAASDGTYADHIHVAWTAPTGGAYYMVSRSTRPTTATATAITGWVPGAAYDDPVGEPDIEPHIRYYYWVRVAVDASGAAASGFSAGDPGWAGAGPAFPSSYRGTIWIVR